MEGGGRASAASKPGELEAIKCMSKRRSHQRLSSPSRQVEALAETESEMEMCLAVPGNCVYVCVCVCRVCCVRGMQNMCESNVIKMLKRCDAMPKSKQQRWRGEGGRRANRERGT